MTCARAQGVSVFTSTAPLARRWTARRSHTGWGHAAMNPGRIQPSETGRLRRSLT
jgi:hypothetical protein